MRCDRFEARVYQLLDRRIDPAMDEQLRDHAEVCETCGELFRAQEDLFVGLTLTEPSLETDEFVQRVVDSAQPQTASVGLPTTVWTAVAALSALVLIAVLPWLQAKGTQSGRNTSAASQPYDKPGTTSPPTGATESFGLVMSTTSVPADRPDRRHNLPSEQDMTVAWTELALRWQAIGSQWSASKNRESQDWMRQFTGGLRPLTTSMSSAINVVRSTLDGQRELRTTKPQARSSHVPPRHHVV